MNINDTDITTPDQVVEFFNTLDSLDDRELWAALKVAKDREIEEMIQEELAARLAYRMPGSITRH